MLHWAHLEFPWGAREQLIFNPPANIHIIRAMYPKATVRAMTEEEISDYKRKRHDAWLAAQRTTEC